MKKAEDTQHINEIIELHTHHISYPSEDTNLHTHNTIEHDAHLEIKPKEEGITCKENIRIPLTDYNYYDMVRAMFIEFIACIINMMLHNYAEGNLQTIIFGFFILLLTLYPVAGANMNGALSLALWYYEEEFNMIHTIRRWSYILVIQPLGLFVGHMVSLLVIGPNLIYIKPRDSHPWRIAFCEFFWTGVFIFITIHTVVCKHTRPSEILAINFIVFFVMIYFVILAASKISGSSINPTSFLVTQGIAVYRGVEPDALRNWYCYIFPQFIGTIVFVLIFKYLFEPLYYRIMSLKTKWENSFFPDKYEKVL